jgi:hypothetical protein
MQISLMAFLKAFLFSTRKAALTAFTHAFCPALAAEAEGARARTPIAAASSPTTEIRLPRSPNDFDFKHRITRLHRLVGNGWRVLSRHAPL